MLHLYSVFHCNLAFSLIPRAHYGSVIERCYSPVLDLCEEGFPLALEMPAWTLKAAASLCPSFVERLKGLWEEGRCEFIGSGYSQAIFPLIPEEVNRWNLEAGTRIYRELLGRAPDVALVNEQTYSRGLTDLYREAGYGTVIMDWDNPFRHNKYPKESLYRPQRARGIRSDANVLWSTSIGFQKFQRCVHGEITMDEYLEYLGAHYKDGSRRVFSLYTNDAEVFDYRPGGEANPTGEFARIREILRRISGDRRFSLITPSGAVGAFRDDPEAFNIVRIESPESPVVTKKQEKYNPVRWAVAGRDSVHVNTECYRVYRNIAEIARKGIEPERTEALKESLCDLWGSDFRTNTIDEKFQYFQNRIGWLKVETERLLDGAHARGLAPAYAVATAPSIVAPTVLMAGSSRSAVISTAENTMKVETPAVTAEFLRNKGFAIKTLAFPGVSSKPLTGTLSHGYYEDIRYGADFFSAHLIHTSRDGKKTTDLVKPDEILVNEDSGAVTLTLKSSIGIGTLWKIFSISKDEPVIDVSYRLKVQGLHASSLRLGIFTLIPSSFDRESLRIETANGGGPERFYLKGHTVCHDEAVSPSVSASGCLGATSGWVRIGDCEKTIEVSTDKEKLFSVPMLRYEEFPGDGQPGDRGFFLRLLHSIGEVDDTAWWVWRGYNEASFSIRAISSQEER